MLCLCCCFYQSDDLGDWHRFTPGSQRICRNLRKKQPARTAVAVTCCGIHVLILASLDLFSVDMLGVLDVLDVLDMLTHLIYTIVSHQCTPYRTRKLSRKSLQLPWRQPWASKGLCIKTVSRQWLLPTLVPAIKYMQNLFSVVLRSCYQDTKGVHFVFVPGNVTLNTTAPQIFLFSTTLARDRGLTGLCVQISNDMYIYILCKIQ